MTESQYKELIRTECNKAAVHYSAMLALAEREGVDIDGDDVPTPAPTPEPTPTPDPVPTPTPTPTDEHKLVYNGETTYTITPGESVTISVYDYNAVNTRDVYCEISNEPSVVQHKTYETKIDGGIRIDFKLTASNRGISTLKTYLADDKNNKDKWIVVTVKVK